MDISVLLAYVIGVSLSLIGVLMIVRKHWSTDMLANLSGGSRLSEAFAVFELIAGSIIVYLNNTLVIGYEGLITLIGAFLVFDGLAELVVPKNIEQKITRTLEEDEEEASSSTRFFGFVILALGLYLIYAVI